MEFNKFKIAIAKQFEAMKGHELFRTTVEKDALWETYLGSFPEGTNPIYRERTEHDCTCCKQFIRAVGDVVAIIDGKMVSIWDAQIPGEPAYQAVADALSALVKSKPIDNIFLHYERTAGTDKNFEQITDGVKTWEHFFINIPSDRVRAKGDIGSLLSEPRALHDVLLRSLNELTMDAVDTVLELIAQRSLYRGDEHKFAVESFRKLKVQFDKLTSVEDKDIFAWLNSKTSPASVSKIRNTSIGTLLTDLSNGRDLESAVGAFEAMVAPTNYKRPTSLITKGMIDQAKQKLAELGLTSALERRYAHIQDITINNILYANRDARKAISNDVFDDLSASVAVGSKNFDKVEEVPIERFIADILPRAESLEVMLENRLVSNLVSLIAPVDPTAGGLFKWPNNFSWTYNGEVTDSIKERVKKAGGNVTGDLCCRLAWDYSDDLDFHMIEPGGYEIYFGNRRQKSPNGGMLDVDANGADGIKAEPVENIFYSDKKRMREGEYVLAVHNYNQRQTAKVGFEVEIDFQGAVNSFVYEKALRRGETVVVARFRYTHANGIEILSSLPSTTRSKDVWALPTQTFHKVNVMMLSPNHWDGHGVGNKHYFFMLDGCKCEGDARGFFNEFLKEDLNAHRKVFEVLGTKVRVAESSDQLSGLGFSSTQKNSLICRVQGSFTRTIKIVF